MTDHERWVRAGCPQHKHAAYNTCGYPPCPHDMKLVEAWEREWKRLHAWKPAKEEEEMASEDHACEVGDERSAFRQWWYRATSGASIASERFDGELLCRVHWFPSWWERVLILLGRRVVIESRTMAEESDMFSEVAHRILRDVRSFGWTEARRDAD